MAIKEATYTIPDGDDAGKVFIIRRMTALKADRWARHLIKALTRAGIELPDDALSLGLSALGGQAQALWGQLNDEAADTALAELLGTVRILRDPQNPASEAAVTDLDIEAEDTLTRLYVEAFRMHVGFFKAAAFQLSPLVGILAPQAASDEAQPAA